MGRKRTNKSIRQVELRDEIKMSEIAKLFSVTRQTVRNWLDEGKLRGPDIVEVVRFYCEKHKKV